MDRNDRFMQRARELLGELTLEEKLHLLTTHQQGVERLGINDFYIGHEVARGFVGRDDEHYSTVFPQPIGLASTFDRRLMEELGKICGDECRAYYNKEKRGCLCVWGPTVDMERDPRWGRTEEAYGEDVFLAGEMTAAYTRTMAGEQDGFYKTIPTLKHFCANNNEYKRGSCNASIPLRLKYEYYYAAFMNAVKYGGARSVMTAYNEINGIPAMCNPELNSVLKDKWGLWFAVTDGADFSQTVTAHHYCERHSEALAEGLHAGCDIMTDNAELTANAAREGLKNGILTEQDIDSALENVLYARARLGHFSEHTPFDGIGMDVLESSTSDSTNLRAAMEQVVLLKNDGILPLRDVGGRIAVCGPLADESLKDWYTGTYRSAVSVLDGMRAEFPDCEIVHDSLWDIVAIKAPNGKYLSAKEDGRIIADADKVTEAERFELQDWGENWKNLFSVKYRRYVRNTDGELRLHNRTIYDWFTHETFNTFDTEKGTLIEAYLGHERLMLDDKGLSFTHRRSVGEDVLFRIETVSAGKERAAELASSCGTVIYCTGNYPVQVAQEGYDRRTLKLNIQEGMTEFLHSVNPATVLLLISSYQYSICREQELLPAILYTTHAGAHLGTAAAHTLSGRNVPSARLPMTWYRSEYDLPDIMEYDIERGDTTYMYFKGEPLYPFGYGLSYAGFRWSGFEVRRTENGAEAELDVENISDTDGTDVVQIYYAVEGSEVSRPIRRLCGFERISLKAGETGRVKISIPEHILQIYDLHRGKFMTETGKYTFMAGASSADIRCRAELDISGEHIGVRGSCFEAQTFDSGDNALIAYSRRLGRQYVTVRGWNGTVKYTGVPFGGRHRLGFKASAYVEPTDAELDICGIKTVIRITASDAADDFRAYSAELPADIPEVGELTVKLSNSAAILDIELI